MHRHPCRHTNKYDKNFRIDYFRSVLVAAMVNFVFTEPVANTMPIFDLRQHWSSLSLTLLCTTALTMPAPLPSYQWPPVALATKPQLMKMVVNYSYGSFWVSIIHLGLWHARAPGEQTHSLCEGGSSERSEEPPQYHVHSKRKEALLTCFANGHTECSPGKHSLIATAYLFVQFCWNGYWT